MAVTHTTVLEYRRTLRIKTVKATKANEDDVVVFESNEDQVTMNRMVFWMMFVEDGIAPRTAYYGDDGVTFVLAPNGESHVVLIAAYEKRPATLIHMSNETYRTLVMAANAAHGASPRVVEDAGMMNEKDVPGLEMLIAAYYEKTPTMVFDKLIGSVGRRMSLEDVRALLLPADIETAQKALERMQQDRLRRYGRQACVFPPTEFVRPGFHKTLLLQDIRMEFWHKHVPAAEKGQNPFRPTQ